MRAAPAAGVGLACLVAVAIAAWLLRPGGGDEATVAAAGAQDEQEAALAASQHFLDAYMEDDGRVVRYDQGGDTVSEGQSYAMLLAVAIGDRERFELAWSWARDNLQRPDGLLSAAWADGAVTDPSPASDADLDAAHALLLASQSFGETEYRSEAVRIGAAVLAQETAATPGGTALVAGPWARESVTVNPSYFAPRAYAALAKASGDRRWEELGRSSREIVTQLTTEPSRLPPDWARIEAGAASAIAAPGETGSAPSYGYDAVRTPTRLAQACDPEDRAVAGGAWGLLQGSATSDEIGARYGLDGVPIDSTTSPAAIVGAAAAAQAAGDPDASGELLARADGADEAAPSYYGAAWVALGRVTLTTDWLGEC
jgi:hypothetical protein